MKMKKSSRKVIHVKPINPGEGDVHETSPHTNIGLSKNSITGTLSNRNDRVYNAKQGIISNGLKEFFEETSIHGLKNITKDETHFSFRIIWSIAFLVPVISAMYYVSVLYRKWNESPVIISFSPRTVDLDSIPFPAVTFCTLKRRCDKYVKTIFIRPHTANIFQAPFLFQGRKCCTFNAVKPEFLYRNLTDDMLLNVYHNLHAIDWKAEKGFGSIYNETISVPIKPTAIPGSLRIVFMGEDNTQELVQILVHSPTDVPNLAGRGEWYSISYGYSVKLYVTPQLVDSTDSLINVKLDDRNCYFQSERYLRYFKTYSESNCQLECIANKTLKECGFYPFYLPNMNGLKRNPQNSNHKGCKVDHDILSDTNYEVCNCLPPCKDLTYTVTKNTLFPKVNTLSYSEVYIEIKDGMVHGLHRSEFITLSNFVSSIGGLLGLFMGFSIMSIMEIMHFTSLNFWRLLK